MAPRTPPIDRRDARTSLVDLAALYNAGTLGVPSPFFPTPPTPEIALTPQGEGPLGTQVVDLAWESRVPAVPPAARDLHLRVRENLTAHARWWTSDRGRPTIVLLHGWGGGGHWVTARAFVVPYWLRHGFDVAAFVLPYPRRARPGRAASAERRAVSVAESAAHERGLRAGDLRSARAARCSCARAARARSARWA